MHTWERVVKTKIATTKPSPEIVLNTGDPVWISFFGRKCEEFLVVKSSRTHWTVNAFGRDYRIPKACSHKNPYFRHIPGDGHGVSVFLTKRAMEDDFWVSRHVYKIADAVRGVDDADVLRRIASLLGMNIGESE